MSLKGNLESFSLGEIFQSLSINQHTGTLKIHDGEIQKLIYFTNGHIIHLSTGKKDDFRLADMLVWSGHITMEQADAAVQEQRTTGRRLGEILMEKEWATEEHISEMVRKNIEEEIYDLFLWKKADFEFHVDYFPEEFLDPDQKASRVQLTTNSLIMEALRRIDEWTVIRDRINTLKAIFAPAAGGVPIEQMADIDLPETVKGEVALVDGRRNVAEIVSASPASKFEVCKLLYELLLRHMIRPLAVKDLVAAAEEQFAAGAFVEARKFLEYAVEQEPKNPDLQLQLADAFEHTAADKLAVDAYMKAAKLHAEHEEHEMEVVAFRKALELEPRNPEIMESLFQAMIKANKLVQAQTLGLELGELLRESLQFSKAVRVYEKLAEKDPKETSVRMLLASALKGKGDLERAIEEYNAVADQLEREMRFTELERVYRILKALATKDEDLIRIRQKYDRIERRRESVERRRKLRFYGTFFGVIIVIALGVLELWAISDYQNIRWPAAFSAYVDNGKDIQAVFALVELEPDNHELYDEYWNDYQAWIGPGGELTRARRELDDFQGKHRVSFRSIVKARADRRSIELIRAQVSDRAESLRQIHEKKKAEKREQAASERLETAMNHLMLQEPKKAFEKLLEIWNDFGDTEVRADLRFPVRIVTDPPGTQVYIDGSAVAEEPAAPSIYLFAPSSASADSFSISVTRPGYEMVKRESLPLDTFQDVSLGLDRMTIGEPTELDGASQGQLVPVEGQLVVCTRGGSTSRDGGATLYRYKVSPSLNYIGGLRLSSPGGTIRPPLLHDGTLLVATDEGKLWSLAEPPQVLASLKDERSKLLIPITAGPEALGRSIYFGAFDGKIHRIDTSLPEARPVEIFSGAEDTIREIRVISSPDPGRGNVWIVATSLDEWVRVIRADTGEVIWQHGLGSDPGAPPVVSGDLVAVGTREGALLLLGLEDGDLQKTMSLDGPVTSLLAREGVLFAGVAGDTPHVQALSLPDLDPVWGPYSTKGAPDTGFLLDGGRLVFGDRGGRLTVLDLSTGELVWDFQARREDPEQPVAISARPAVIGGRVYVGDSLGRLYVLERDISEE